MRNLSLRSCRFFFLCLFALQFSTFSLGSRTASASQAIPSATPTASTCDVAPRSLSEILVLTQQAPREARPVCTMPIGEPADPATTEAITAVLQQMGACLTGGEMLRFYALHTDDWIRQTLGRIEGFATLTISIPSLDDGHRALYLGPWHVQMLEDGRILAAVLLRAGDELRPDPNRVRALLFIHHDGQWLVDETIEHVRLADCALPVEVAAVVGPPPGALFDTWSASCN